MTLTDEPLTPQDQSGCREPPVLWPFAFLPSAPDTRGEISERLGRILERLGRILAHLERILERLGRILGRIWGCQRDRKASIIEH